MSKSKIWFLLIVVLGCATLIAVAMELRTPQLIFEAYGVRQTNYGAFGVTFKWDTTAVPGLSPADEVLRELKRSAPLPSFWHPRGKGFASKLQERNSTTWGAAWNYEGDHTKIFDHYKKYMATTSQFGSPEYAQLRGIDRQGRSICINVYTMPSGTHDVRVDVTQANPSRP
jgi:hypothetical protein